MSLKSTGSLNIEITLLICALYKVYKKGKELANKGIIFALLLYRAATSLCSSPVVLLGYVGTVKIAVTPRST